MINSLKSTFRPYVLVLNAVNFKSSLFLTSQLEVLKLLARRLRGTQTLVLTYHITVKFADFMQQLFPLASIFFNFTLIANFQVNGDVHPVVLNSQKYSLENLEISQSHQTVQL